MRFENLKRHSLLRGHQLASFQALIDNRLHAGGGGGSKIQVAVALLGQVANYLRGRSYLIQAGNPHGVIAQLAIKQTQINALAQLQHRPGIQGNPGKNNPSRTHLQHLLNYFLLTLRHSVRNHYQQRIANLFSCFTQGAGKLIKIGII